METKGKGRHICSLCPLLISCENCSSCHVIYIYILHSRFYIHLLTIISYLVQCTVLSAQCFTILDTYICGRPHFKPKPEPEPERRTRPRAEVYLMLHGRGMTRTRTRRNRMTTRTSSSWSLGKFKFKYFLLSPFCFHLFSCLFRVGESSCSGFWIFSFLFPVSGLKSAVYTQRYFECGFPWMYVGCWMWISTSKHFHFILLLVLVLACGWYKLHYIIFYSCCCILYILDMADFIFGRLYTVYCALSMYTNLFVFRSRECSGFASGVTYERSCVNVSWIPIPIPLQNSNSKSESKSVFESKF